MNAITEHFLKLPQVQKEVHEFRIFCDDVMVDHWGKGADGKKEAQEIVGAAQVLIGQKNLVLLLGIANKIDAEHSPGIQWAKAMRKK